MKSALSLNKLEQDRGLRIFVKMVQMLRNGFVISLTLFTSALLAQTPLQRNDAIVVTEGPDTLKMPWAGGLNSVLYSNLDLDQDGTPDLVLHDRTGKMLAFIQQGAAGAIDFEFAPIYHDKFPQVQSWMLMADYNCDGLKDIFTYYIGGIRVYKNVSTGTNLAFVLAASHINSFQFPNNIPIYASSIDLPVIKDIDGDGDLDILSFGVSTTSVNHHKNLSMEMFGTCDSLKYELTTECWGKFEEGSSSFNISLNSCQKSNMQRHGGSSLLAFDQDGDDDMELIIGDDGYNKFTFLKNGGNPNLAVMDSVAYNFPFYHSKPVDLATFPAPSLADVNNDGREDLLVSPFPANQGENLTSSLLYIDSGMVNPYFSFVTDNFLQGEMIDVGEGAFPVFFDYDQDGATDLLVGNFGYFISSGSFRAQLALFRNTKTNSNPEYELLSRDFAGLGNLNLRSAAPTFGDLDADGDKDMLVGIEDGTLIYFENIGPTGGSAVFTISQLNYFGLDVGSNATPQLVDMDRDGKLDLVIGEKDGSLNYVRNIGTASSASFSSSNIKTQFGGVQVSAPGWIFGFSTPWVFEVAGNYQLLVGSENGKVHYYTNIDGNLAGTFLKKTGDYYGIQEGTRTAVTTSAISASGSGQVIVGNYRGGLSFYEGQVIVSMSEYQQEESWNPRIFPNPTKGKLQVEAEGFKGEVTLSDLRGRILLKAVMDGHLYLDLGNYAAGLYLLRFDSEQKSVTHKIVMSR